MAHQKQADLLEELKSARLNSGLTQHELAQKTGIPRTTISKIEAGFRNTTLNTLLDLSKAVNLDLKLVKQNLIASAKKLERNFSTLNLIKIEAEKIISNYDFFANKFPDHEIWPVLKANAYGHGIEQIAQILDRRHPRYLIVDSYFEALQIWKNHPHQSVLLIGSLLPENFTQISYEQLALTIYNVESLVALGNLNLPIKIHLKVNTGMNRQGLLPNEIENFCNKLKEYPQIILEGVMSHLADADNDDLSYTKFQEEQFVRSIKLVQKNGFDPKYKHLDATAGSVVTDKKHTNVIRLGLGLYGHNPLRAGHPHHHKLTSLQPALSFSTKIINIIRLSAGQKVSYGGTFVAKKPTTIGVLPVGYYDFYERRMSNQVKVIFDKKSYQQVGNICMNMVMIDFDNASINLYDEVEVISNTPEAPNCVESLSKISKTIAYEILVKINQSTRRIIV